MDCITLFEESFIEGGAQGLHEQGSPARASRQGIVSSSKLVIAQVSKLRILLSSLIADRPKHLSSLFDMESVQACKALPEELVARIVAMMPFPSIFKARALSKSWRSRFAPVSSIDDEVEKGLTIAFQKEVGRWSQNWETFSPVSFGEDLGSAYDKNFRNGSKMASLSFLPKTLLNTSYPNMEGPILCGHSPSNASLFVANILTRSWKHLPPLPFARERHFLYWTKLVRETSSETYKVIVACLGCRQGSNLVDQASFQIYDSLSDAWIGHPFSEAWISENFGESGTKIPPAYRAAYLNGVLYVIGHDMLHLLAFNVQEGTWEKIRLTSFTDRPNLSRDLQLVVCNANLLIIGTEPFHMGYVHMLKIDLASKQVSTVTRGPPDPVDTSSCKAGRLRPFSDGNDIFFGTTHQLVIYNVKEDRWRWRWFDFRHLIFMSPYESSAFCFEPGLNPFAEV